MNTSGRLSCVKTLESASCQYRRYLKKKVDEKT